MAEETVTKTDSMGDVQVPASALYGATTQRAVDIFPSQRRLPARFVQTLAAVKIACAQTNNALGLMPDDMRAAVQAAAERVRDGELAEQFPISAFQTGSGTSTNMNVNEVVAALAAETLGAPVHPNDHVNMSQSSNDVVPTTLNAAAYVETAQTLLPALEALQVAIADKAATLRDVVTTGRTHLMDAMPITLAQSLSGWAAQVSRGKQRVEAALERVRLLPIGGTAVGTGINCPPEFGARVCAALGPALGLAGASPFEQNDCLFEGISAVDAVVELSGQLKTVAVSLMKISNDLRWMNSGPQAGMAEVALEALAPGSSIMPGKVNPVLPEAVCMICAQVMGNDVTVTVGGQAGNFQLNVMLPVIAVNVLESAELLADACGMLARTVASFEPNRERMADLAQRNPILVTALNPVVGYMTGARIAKASYAQGRPVKEVAQEMTSLSAEELDRLLDPLGLTQGGVASA